MVAGEIQKVYQQHGDDGKHQLSFLMDPEEREDACTIEDHLNLTPWMSKISQITMVAAGRAADLRLEGIL
jgi:hypothetical protein